MMRSEPLAVLSLYRSLSCQPLTLKRSVIEGEQVKQFSKPPCTKPAEYNFEEPATISYYA